MSLPKPSGVGDDDTYFTFSAMLSCDLLAVLPSWWTHWKLEVKKAWVVSAVHRGYPLGWEPAETREWEMEGNKYYPACHTLRVELYLPEMLKPSLCWSPNPQIFRMWTIEKEVLYRSHQVSKEVINMGCNPIWLVPLQNGDIGKRKHREKRMWRDSRRRPSKSQGTPEPVGCQGTETWNGPFCVAFRGCVACQLLMFRLLAPKQLLLL